ncbi:MAG: hypothetical protein KAS63_10520 [Candidatus Heimdallarchaeota archaeon]|nr:hypothetical protein [Candidatus Heimdallarchaeota archaeon]MCK4955788.1 hypothetical protein [Candidatus Heimdallarchaeota archaeon]
MSKTKTDDTEVLREGIKKFNKKWIDNKIFFIVSLILAPSTFVGGFFTNKSEVLTHQNHPIWQSAIVATFFVLSVGFFVVVFSYLFNQVWLLTLREGKKEQS